MKIAIDCRELIEHPTGISRVLDGFISYAAGLPGLDLQLLGNQRTCFPEIKSGNIKKVIIKERFTFFWDQFKLPRALRGIRPDIFFSPYYKMPLFCPVPAVISIFDLTYLLVEPYKSRPVNFLYAKNLIRLTLHSAKRVVTCSEHSKKDIIGQFNFDAGRIDVIYLYPDDKFKPESADRIREVKNKYGIKGAYLLNVGNSNPHKNLRRLKEAYLLLPPDFRRDNQLVLAGADRYISDIDLPALYSGAKMLVFPSLYEGFGNPPLEAFACGCPVASSNASCLPEIYGDACVYFDPLDPAKIASAIFKIAGDAGLARELREKGLKRAALFTSEKTNRGLLDSFRKAIEGSN